MHKSRLTKIKRVIRVSKESYMCQKRSTYIKRDLNLTNKNYVYQRRLILETYPLKYLRKIRVLALDQYI